MLVKGQSSWTLHTLQVEIQKWYSHFGKQFGSFLTELNIHLLYDPAVLVLGICPREMKTCVHTDTCAQMFITASFIIAHNWEPLKYLTSEWINKLIPPCSGKLHRKRKRDTPFRWICKSLCWVKKLVSKSYRLSDSINMTFSKRQTRWRSDQ